MSSYSSHKKPGQKYTICSCLAHRILAHRAPTFFLKNCITWQIMEKTLETITGPPLGLLSSYELARIVHCYRRLKKRLWLVKSLDGIRFTLFKKTLPSSLTTYITSADVKHSDFLGIVWPITNNLLVDYDHTGKLKVNIAWWNTKYY